MGSTSRRSNAGVNSTCALACAWMMVACGPAYRSPVLFKDRVISQEKPGAAEYAVYSAALLEFVPDHHVRDWIAVTGVTIPAEPIDPTLFDSGHRAVVQSLARRLLAANDTVYVIDERFAESLSVAVTPLMDTVNWVPVQWHRTLHRTYPSGLVNFSRVVFDSDGQWALVYGLSGKGPVGTGFPRAVLLRKDGARWAVAASQPLGQ